MDEITYVLLEWNMCACLPRITYVLPDFESFTCLVRYCPDGPRMKHTSAKWEISDQETKNFGHHKFFQEINDQNW